MTTLRVLSYNVRSLRDDSAAVARVIRAAAPDVVCVQEVPRFLRWRSACAALARRSGLVVVGGGRPAGANLLMSGLAVTVEAVHDVAFTSDPRLHRRGTALAVLALSGQRFALAGTHLDLADEPRRRHVGELHAALDRFVPAGVPAIVAADVNEQPGLPAWAALARRGRDAFAEVGTGDGSTYSATRPTRRIDGVFVDPPLRVESARVLDGADIERASDHRPLLVEIDLRR